MMHRKKGNTNGPQVDGPLTSTQVVSTLEAEYTDAELEFLRAVARLKKTSPFPTWNQVFALVIDLGYRKAVSP